MTTYTCITFAPVQGFIEKSRKLRDLYGSSFILSFLAKAICECTREEDVIVPARTEFTRGVANIIYLYHSIDDPLAFEAKVRKAFNHAWKALVDNCREYIEECCSAEFPDSQNSESSWNREWNLWANHTWELFIVCGEEGETLEAVRGKMADRKQSRDWIGINWRGESSTISGTDAIAYPTMTSFNPKPQQSYEHGIGEADLRIKDFFITLSEQLPESAIEPNERLSIPELIKRLITYPVVVNRLRDKYTELPTVEYPHIFSRLQLKESKYWKGWFQGDGDRMGAYIESLVEGAVNNTEQNQELQAFSGDMLRWGEGLQGRVDHTLINGLQGRIVYAGGDDFFGVLYREDESLTPQNCLEQFWYGFDDLWKQCGRDISVSTGFVWAAPNIPQRDLLQHLRQTEKAAKNAGRDRLAIRILFNSGNHLDWQCPWKYLKEILEGYRDRSGGNNWTHLYNDIAVLEARHAFVDSDRSVAQGIFDIYFPEFKLQDKQLWTPRPPENEPYQILNSGLLGFQARSSKNQQEAENKQFNQWVINLANVGFHLFPNIN